MIRCHFARLLGDRKLKISDVARDQKTTKQALDALTEVARRYPNTRYAADARLKIDLVNDHLAGKEMEIGRYYLMRGEHLAAVAGFAGRDFYCGQSR